jgi:hypothetical protein
LHATKSSRKALTRDHRNKQARLRDTCSFAALILGALNACERDCPKSKHVSYISAVDADKFRLLQFLRIAYALLTGEGQSMRAHWERTLVVATLAIAIIVCLWGIKILLAA